MTAGWRDCLGDELRRLAPASICALDQGALEVAQAVMPATAVALAQRAPLALVMHALDGLDAAAARICLAQARDACAPCIVVIATANCALDRLAFLALGYDALGIDTAENIALYRHDLATYKTVPDWLNARYWAHPERWKS
jgi:hypothetical protein